MKEHIKKKFQLKMRFIMLLAFNVFCISSAYGANDSKNKPKDTYVVYDPSLSMAKK